MKQKQFDFFKVGMIIFFLWEIMFMYVLLNTKPSNAPRYSNEGLNSGFSITSVYLVLPLIISGILVLIGAMKKKRAEQSKLKSFFDKI